MLPARSQPPPVALTLGPGDVLVDEIDGTRFEAHELVGRGGMGEVYRATRLTDGAPVALKCVRRDLIGHPKILLRTRFEAKAFRRIDHPNVVRVLGTGVRDDDVPWMAMEWLDGLTVAQILERRGRVPLRWAVEIVRDLCLGLHAIHEHAIHRDIKPSNVHFGRDGVTRALDLGAAKSMDPNVDLTSTGYQPGTLPFMAPEQLESAMEIDHRADLWGATVVLYMLMTGIHPFEVHGRLPENNIKLGFGILTSPHRPLLSALSSAPPLLAEIIDRGLAKDPTQRHGSAEELSRALTAALEHPFMVAGEGEPLANLARDLETEAVAAPPRSPRSPPGRSAELRAAIAMIPSGASSTERLVSSPSDEPTPQGLYEAPTIPKIARVVDPRRLAVTPRSPQRRPAPQSIEEARRRKHALLSTGVVWRSLGVLCAAAIAGALMVRLWLGSSTAAPQTPASPSGAAPP